MSGKELSFETVDELAFAVGSGQIDAAVALAPYAAKALGPLLELNQLVDSGRLPKLPHGKSWLTKNRSMPLIDAFRDQRKAFWLAPDDRRMGFIRTQQTAEGDEEMLAAFLMAAQKAARDISKLPGKIPGQLAAAMKELENNIHEHSYAENSGILAFRAAIGEFEFVAADKGIGILASLRSCQLYASMTDHGLALRTALTDGHSRYGSDSGHGHGFRPIFLGLANLQGFLRFRSGDHALSIDGTNPHLAMAQLAQKPTIDGFFASIRCYARGVNK